VIAGLRRFLVAAAIADLLLLREANKRCGIHIFGEFNVA
jgi:hypothetical protein